jgi:3-oxoacyl-[acyl-carrier protein] reductase
VNGKRILITGASRGIGRAIAELAAAAGARVGVNFLASEAAANELRDRFPDRVILLKADVRDSSAVSAMMTAFIAEAGRIDVLVNNAGVAQPALLLRQPAAEIQSTVATNLLGSIYATQAALGHMVRQRGGLVIFHSSIAVESPRPGLAAYAASKAGLEAFARSVGLEYRKRGVRTVCLRLGPVRTEMYAARAEPERQQIEARLLANRVPGPDAVARFIGALFCSEDTLLDGSVVTLDSGYSLGVE